MPLDLAAAEFGAGPPVVILHGLFGSGLNWRTIGQRLAERHRVFALDLRNHGSSPWADSMRYAEMADDVRAFIARRGLGAAALIGHSMGGKVAMTLALAAPETVERLVVVDIAPVVNPPTLLGYVRAMRAVDPSGFRRRGEADPLLAEAVRNPAERAFLLQNLAPVPGGGFRWRLNLAAIERSMTEIVGWTEPAPGAAYAGPTLFVAGARSDYIRDADRPAIARLFPNARIATVPEAGHWVHAERPEAFLAIVEPFLAGKGDTGGR